MKAQGAAKRFLSFLLAVLLVFSSISGSVVYAEDDMEKAVSVAEEDASDAEDTSDAENTVSASEEDISDASADASQAFTDTELTESYITDDSASSAAPGDSDDDDDEDPEEPEISITSAGFYQSSGDVSTQVDTLNYAAGNFFYTSDTAIDITDPDTTDYDSLYLSYTVEGDPGDSISVSYSVTITLPDGISFSQNELVSSKTFTVEYTSARSGTYWDQVYLLYSGSYSSSSSSLELDYSADGVSSSEGVTICALNVISTTGSITLKEQDSDGNYYTTSWNRNMFDYDADTWQNEIALLSAYLSQMMEGSDKADLAERIEYDLLHLGFSHIQYSGSTDSLITAGNEEEYVCATKKIVNSAGEAETLVIYAIQGSDVSGYSGSNWIADWVGNTKGLGIQTDALNKYHENFATCISNNYVSLSSYLSDQSVSTSDDSVRMLVTGHSRGGTIANGVGTTLADNGYFSDHLYCYTFAAANYLSASNSSAEYPIFNVVNTRDVVPYLPTNYYKNGIYKAFSDSRTDVSNHNMRGYIDAVKADDWIENYDATLELAKNISVASDSATTVLADAAVLSVLAAAASAGTASAAWAAAVAMVKGRIAVSAAASALSVICQFRCPVDIEVLDSDGISVLGILDDEILYCLDENVTVMVDGDDKYIYYPQDEGYTINVVGYADGTMDFTCILTDEDGNDETVYLFDDIEVAEDETVLTASDSDGTAVFADAEGTQMTADETLTGDDLYGVTVELSSDLENVTLYGAGSYTRGGVIWIGYETDEIDETDETDETEYEFLGWYDDEGNLVSEDNAFSLIAQEDIALTAKFAAAEGETEYLGSGSNQFYEDELTEDLLDDLQDQADSDEGTDDLTYYETAQEAGEALRELMTQRETTCYLGYRTSSLSEASGVYEEIVETAFAHTGVADEGDYLVYNLNYYSAYRHYEYDSDESIWNITYTFYMSYRTTAAQEQAVDEAVETLLSDLGIDGKSDLKKIFMIYDYICSNVEYDYDYTSYTAYDALINHASVCQGYALLVYRLMNEAGIDCRIISGYAADDGAAGDSHAWNIVKIGDLYYELDATWDAGQTLWNYYLQGSTVFDEEHLAADSFLEETFTSVYPISETAYSRSANSSDDGDEDGDEDGNTDLADAVISTGRYYIYGSDSLPQLQVYLDGLYLTEGTDYTVTFDEDASAGQLFVTVTGIGSYTGTQTGYINIYFSSEEEAGAFLLSQVENRIETVYLNLVTTVYGWENWFEIRDALWEAASAADGWTYVSYSCLGYCYETDSCGETVYYVQYRYDITYEEGNEEDSGSEDGNTENTGSEDGNAEDAGSEENAGHVSHSYSMITVEATCAQEGYTIYTCTVCGASYTETIAKTSSHDYSGNVCTICGALKTSTISSSAVTLSKTSYTCSGSACKPAVTVQINGTTLTCGTDYTVSYSDNINTGTAKVTVTGKGSYSGSVTKTFMIKAQTLSSSRVTLSYTSKTYTGKSLTPSVSVKNSSGTKLTRGTDYTITYSKSTRKNVGTYRITIKGTGNYGGSVTKSYKITQASQKLTVKTSTKTVKYSRLKKAKQTVAAVTKVAGAKGKVTYSKISGSSKLTVNKSTGKITVKKGTKKGTYKIKVKVTSAATTNYKKAAGTVTLTVKVK